MVSEKSNITLHEIRCSNCNKFLGKVSGPAEIKCPRCGKLQKINQDGKR